MNCKQANTKISIKNVLESFSLLASKENSKSAFYYAFDRVEKTPSLSVNYLENTAFDFGTGKKYDCVSLVQGIKRCSISEALSYLSQFDFSFQKQNTEIALEEKKYKIISVGSVKHLALIQYLKKRNVSMQIDFLEEIHYQLNDKNYFAIAFKNDSGGYEIRNKYVKICLGIKDITTIENDSKTLRIFEGFMDFLSWKIIENSLEEKPSDYIILNTIYTVNRLEKLKNNYENIEVFLDNDSRGEQTKAKLIEIFSVIKDQSILYKGHKDLNDFLQKTL